MKQEIEIRLMSTEVQKSSQMYNQVISKENANTKTRQINNKNIQTNISNKNACKNSYIFKLNPTNLKSKICYDYLGFVPERKS